VDRIIALRAGLTPQWIEKDWAKACQDAAEEGCAGREKARASRHGQGRQDSQASCREHRGEGSGKDSSEECSQGSGKGAT